MAEHANLGPSRPRSPPPYFRVLCVLKTPDDEKAALPVGALRAGSAAHRTPWWRSVCHFSCPPFPLAVGFTQAAMFAAFCCILIMEFS